VDPIRAKSCRSLRSLFCGRSVIALPVDQQRLGEGPRVTALALALAMGQVCQGLCAQTQVKTLFLSHQRLLDSSSCRKPPHISIKSFTRRPLRPLLSQLRVVGQIAPYILHSSDGVDTLAILPRHIRTFLYLAQNTTCWESVHGGSSYSSCIHPSI
jgi:hypothetical protein